jgi:hypothetical protein
LASTCQPISSQFAAETQSIVRTLSFKSVVG